MADYDTLIDAETWAFIAKTAETYPDDAVDLDIAGQRRVYNAMCRAFWYRCWGSLAKARRQLCRIGWRRSSIAASISS